MPSKRTESVSSRVSMEAMRLEQELCLSAVLSGEYDDMSDADWVVLCEQMAQQAVAKKKAPEN